MQLITIADILSLMGGGTLFLLLIRSFAINYIKMVKSFRRMIQ